MLQNLAAKLESRLGRDRASNFRGTALIKFEYLKFGHKPNKAKTKRLINVLREERCFKLEPLNRIKALINDEELDNAITASGTTQQELFENSEGIPPSLTFLEDSRVLYLKGASRIEAAKQVLYPQDQEWAIDLFLPGISTAL